MVAVVVKATSSLIFGLVNVLLVNVSVPARVARVPVVGNVTFVVLVVVSVSEYAPDVIKEAPSAMVKVADVAGAVIATLLMEVAVATPNTGVTKVGLVSTTNFVPVPVCEAMEVVLPTLVMTPVKLALVVTFPAVKLAAVPVNPVPAPVNEVAVTVPLTSKAVPGAVVPIPTFPVLR